MARFSMSPSLFRAGLGVVLVTVASPRALPAETTVVGGTTNDYQASVIIPWDDESARLLVFERLGSTFSGDLWLTRSADAGATWSEPTPVVISPDNERHASLVQISPGGYALFYLKGVGFDPAYAIHWATADDDLVFTEHGAVDVGWSVGAINPHVIREPDGTLTMTYHRIGGAAYIAQSRDNGATWDGLRTPVSPGIAALPRIAFRESDGMHLLVYQTGRDPVTLWVKTTFDPLDGSVPARRFTLDGNNHDALPMVLPDDSFVILWSRFINGGFQVVSSRSTDGVAWQPMLQHTDRAGLANIQPHALPGPASHRVELYWGAAQQAGDADYDIVREPAAFVAEVIFEADFERP